MHHAPQGSWARLTVRLVSGKWGLACAAGPACPCLTLSLYIIYRQNQGGIFSFF